MSLESPGILMNDIKAETKNLFSYITAIIYNLFNAPGVAASLSNPAMETGV